MEGVLCDATRAPHEATHWTARAMDGPGRKARRGDSATELGGAWAGTPSPAGLQALPRSCPCRETRRYRGPQAPAVGDRLPLCQALFKAGIDGFTDFGLENGEFAEAMILGLPGQSSGIAFNYFMMLAGDDNPIKPNRTVHRFVSQAVCMVASNSKKRQFDKIKGAVYLPSSSAAQASFNMTAAT